MGQAFLPVRQPGISEQARKRSVFGFDAYIATDSALKISGVNLVSLIIPHHVPQFQTRFIDFFEHQEYCHAVQWADFSRACLFPCTLAKSASL
jgi:hypothetical protein